MTSRLPKLEWMAPTLGVLPHLAVRDLPAKGLANASNMILRKGRLTSRSGLVQLENTISIGERPLGLLEWDRNSASGTIENNLLLGTDGGWWKFDEGTGVWDTITDPSIPLTGDADSLVVMRPFALAGVTGVIGCNSKDTMRWWNGASFYYQEVTGPSPVAVVTAADVVMAGGHAGGTTWLADPKPTTVYWSANSNPLSWSTADFLNLDSTAGKIVAMLELGGRVVVVYKSDSIFVLTSSGGVSPWQVEDRTRHASGPVSALAAVPITRHQHAFLGRDNAVYLFSGAEPISVGEHVQTMIRETIDRDLADRAWLRYDRPRDELWVFYPNKSSELIDTAIVINVLKEGYPAWPVRWSIELTTGGSVRIKTGTPYQEVTTTYQATTRTYNDFTTRRAALITGKSDGLTFEEIGSLDVTDPIDISIETGPVRYANDPARYLVCSEVDSLFDQTPESQTVQIDIGDASFGDLVSYPDTPTETDLLEPPHQVQFRNCRRRLATLRIQAAASEQIVWAGATLAYALGGYR